MDRPAKEADKVDNALQLGSFRPGHVQGPEQLAGLAESLDAYLRWYIGESAVGFALRPMFIKCYRIIKSLQANADAIVKRARASASRIPEVKEVSKCFLGMSSM